MSVIRIHRAGCSHALQRPEERNRHPGEYSNHAGLHPTPVDATQEELKRKIEEMEAKYDQQFQIVFEAIRQLRADEKPESRIGF